MTRRLLSLGALLALAGVGQVAAYPKLLVDDKRCAVPLQVRRVGQRPSGLRRRHWAGHLICTISALIIPPITHPSTRHRHKQEGQKIMGQPVVQGKGQTVAVRGRLWIVHVDGGNG